MVSVNRYNAGIDFRRQKRQILTSKIDSRVVRIQILTQVHTGTQVHNTNTGIQIKWK